jgi:hypothetical protein
METTIGIVPKHSHFLKVGNMQFGLAVSRRNNRSLQKPKIFLNPPYGSKYLSETGLNYPVQVSEMQLPDLVEGNSVPATTF